MNISNNTFSDIKKKLDKIDQDREKILSISRQMVRNCSVAIKAIHREDDRLYQDKIKEILRDHKDLLDLVKLNPIMFGKYLKTPEQEYIEAVSLYAIINNQEIKSPEEYGVDDVNFLLGLADVVGELRRYILDKLRRDQIKDLNNILEKMENLYDLLFSFDYPKGITQDLRRKTDVARGIIEKTRGDLSLSIQINKLISNLEKK